jgi:hypothetical protein
VIKTADVRFIGPVIGSYTLESRVRGMGLQIFALRVQSISPTALVASAPVTGSVGEQVSAHFAPFGPVRGVNERHIEGGFCVDVDMPPDERSLLASRIEWYKKRTFQGLSDKREHRRFMPREPKSAVVFADGTVMPCLVIDLSASGAAVSADVDPPLNAALALGKLVCRVVRKLDVGFAVQFMQPQDREMLEEVVQAPEDWARAMRAQRGRPVDFGGTEKKRTGT